MPSELGLYIFFLAGCSQISVEIIYIELQLVCLWASLSFDLINNKLVVLVFISVILVSTLLLALHEQGWVLMTTLVETNKLICLSVDNIMDFGSFIRFSHFRNSASLRRFSLEAQNDVLRNGSISHILAMLFIDRVSHIAV